MAVIQVGAATEIELKERKLRIEDALAATRAAVEEGIVPGGGVVLVDCISCVEALADKGEGDEKTGMMIILRALEEPLRQIAENAGAEGSVIVEHVIVDPTKVTRSALQNAASVASMLLTTEAAVANIKEDMPDLGAAGMGGGMGMM